MKRLDAGEIHRYAVLVGHQRVDIALFPGGHGKRGFGITNQAGRGVGRLRFQGGDAGQQGGAVVARRELVQQGPERGRVGGFRGFRRGLVRG